MFTWHVGMPGWYSGVSPSHEQVCWAVQECPKWDLSHLVDLQPLCSCQPQCCLFNNLNMVLDVTSLGLIPKDLPEEDKTILRTQGVDIENPHAYLALFPLLMECCCAEQAGTIPGPSRLVPERSKHPSPKPGFNPLVLSIPLRFWRGT